MPPPRCTASPQRPTGTLPPPHLLPQGTSEGPHSPITRFSIRPKPWRGSLKRAGRIRHPLYCPTWVRGTSQPHCWLFCPGRGQPPPDGSPDSRSREVAAAQGRVTPWNGEGKASTGPGQVSSGASIQPSSAGQEQSKQHTALMCSKMEAAPKNHYKTGSCSSRPHCQDGGTRPASGETGLKLKQQRETKLCSCLCFDPT